jgi:hypothetical protein
LPDEVEEQSKVKSTRPSDNQMKTVFRAHLFRFGANVEAHIAALCVTFRVVLVFAFSAADILATE